MEFNHDQHSYASRFISEYRRDVEGCGSTGNLCDEEIEALVEHVQAVLSKLASGSPYIVTLVQGYNCERPDVRAGHAVIHIQIHRKDSVRPQRLIKTVVQQGDVNFRSRRIIRRVVG